MTTVVNAHQSGSSLSPWVGFGLLCVYALAALVIGAGLMVRRDA